MPFKETINNLLEGLKFSFYSKREAELENPSDTTATATEREVESSYVMYDPFASYSSSQMGQQSVWSASKNEMIRKWREASYLPEVDLALNEIGNEAIIYDEIDDIISLNLNDLDVPDSIKDMMQEAFSKILFLLDFNERGDELFRQWYIDGVLNLEAIYSNDRIRKGIQKLQLLSPFSFTAFIDPVTKQKKYYYGEANTNLVNRNVSKEKVFLDEQITSINSGQWSMDRKFPISFLNKAMKVINQLTNIEDALVIYRITRSPEKRAFYVATGKLNKSKAEEYMRSLISKYRQKRTYNLDTGAMEDKTRSISILEDYWFSVDANGGGTKVESIAGLSPNFTSFEDMDYFVNKVYKALNIPLNRRSSDARVQISTSIDTEKEELRFFKMIVKLRRRFNMMFTDLLKKELLAKDVFSIEDWALIQEKIKYIYANSNEYSEIKNNQVIDMRVSTANNALALVEPGLLSRQWIQENILRFTDEDINLIKKQRIEEAADEQNEGGTEEEEIGHTFGPDYSVNRRGAGGATAPTQPTGETQPEEGSPEPEGAETPVPETAAESKKNSILNILEEGDRISNGKKVFKYTKGKLVKDN